MCVKLDRAQVAVSGTDLLLMNQNQLPKNPFTIRPGMAGSDKSLWSSLLALGLLFSLFSLPLTVKGQTEVTDNFNSYSGPNSDVSGGWTHYMPTAAGGANPSYTFPTNGSGDLGYELIGPSLRCEGILQRGGSYRSEAYSEFSYSADFLNYRSEPGSITLFGFRMQAIAPLSSSGNFAVYLPPTRRQKQGFWANTTHN